MNILFALHAIPHYVAEPVTLRMACDASDQGTVKNGIRYSVIMGCVEPNRTKFASSEEVTGA